jgi:hypothetical protein
MPAAGETSDESRTPSLDEIALLKDLINLIASGLSQKAVATTGADVSVEMAGCVSKGMGVNTGVKVNAGWGVADGSAVGCGGASTGIEQLARINKSRIGKYIFSFIQSPFQKV